MASTKVHVPQESGEIRMATNGDVHEPRVYRVADHLVTADNDDELALLLAHVDGARIATKGDLGEEATDTQAEKQAAARARARAGDVTPSA